MKKGSKYFKKLFCVLMVVLLVACSKPEVKGEASYKAGTYSAVSENGRNGNILMEVAFTDTQIKSVIVKEHLETPTISDIALTRIPEEIVSNQSLNIDSVSGATITSEAILEAVADCVMQAGGDVTALKAKAKDNVGNVEIIEKQVDVVIVGAGATGMAAAVSSAENGAKSVLVLEKMASIGGNAIVSGGYLEFINAPSSIKVDNTAGYSKVIEGYINQEPLNEQHKEYQLALKKEYEAYVASKETKTFDSKYLLALDYYNLDPIGLPESSYEYATLLDDTTSWLTNLGMEWKTLTGIVGYPYPRWATPKVGFEGKGYFDLFNKMIKDKNYPIEIMTETPATELIMENGKVVGIIAKTRDGKEYHIKATNGVVLATGGFSANPEMLMKYNTMWDKLSLETPTTNVAGITGDGIVMAEKVGAALEYMEDIMLFPNADPINNSTENIVGDDGDPLYINKEGVRFVDESLDRYTISGELLEQTDKILYMLSDSENCKIKDGKTFNGHDVEKMITNKQLYRADSIEDLAKLINIDPKVLVGSVDKFNRYALNFKDEEFGRVSFSSKSVVDKAPFYALPRGVATHITGGGLVRNENYEVLDTNSKVIPGLYAGGEVTAYMSGIASFGDGMYIGRELFSK